MRILILCVILAAAILSVVYAAMVGEDADMRMADRFKLGFVVFMSLVGTFGSGLLSWR